MNKFLKYIAVVSISLFAFTACTADAASYDDDLADLTDRVESLEELRETLEERLDDLQTLIGTCVTGGTSISSIVEIEDGVYEITLSSGLTLQVGSSINTTDGVVAIRVSGGYWQYSVDGGYEWQNMLDTDGNPIEASNGFNYWYSSVEVVDNQLIITDTEGNQYTLPIVEGFSLIIEVDDPTISQIFDYEETRTFTVVTEGTTETPMVLSKPEGWGVTYSNGVLSVTSPSEAYVTRASADSDKDISLMVISTSGFAAISKIQVELEGSVDKTPKATVVAGEVTSTTAEFTVALNGYATSWYYIFCPSDDAAPTSIDDFTSGTEYDQNSEMTLSFDALSSSTAYTLYVITRYDDSEGVEDSIVGEIAKVEITTLEKSVAEMDYWVDGFTYNGVTYDQNTSGATLITEDGTIISATGVYFIEPGIDVTLSRMAYKADLVIIGRSGAERSNLIFSDSSDTRVRFQGTSGVDGVFIFKNLNTTNTHFGGNGTVDIDTIMFQDCYIELMASVSSMFYFTSTFAVPNFILDNNYICPLFEDSIPEFSYGNATNTKTFISTSKATAVDKWENISITNNTFFADEVSCIRLIAVNASNEFTTAGLDLEITNNIFYNIASSGGLSTLIGINSCNISKNAFRLRDGWAWDATGEQTQSPFTFINYMTSKSATDTDDVIYGATEAERLTFLEKNNLLDNGGYGTADETRNWTDYYYASVHFVTEEMGTVTAPSAFDLAGVDMFESADVATMTFKLKAEYSSYGPQAR